MSRRVEGESKSRKGGGSRVEEGSKSRKGGGQEWKREGVRS